LAAACVAALEGRRVHVVTPNDYLARRDAGIARSVLSRLGITVGHVTSEMAFAGRAAEKRRKAYERDVVYATAAELALDHLCGRTRSGKGLQPAPPDVAIIDEADTVLLAQAQMRAGLAGEESDAAADQAARADLPVERNVDYVVSDGQVVLVDETTGRALSNRTWPDDLRQAVERREGLHVTPPPRIDAAITFGDYFRLYDRLAGLTGTAFGQRKAFLASYGLPVSVVPTRRPCHRIDHDDRIYPTAEDRDRGLAEEVRHVSRDLGRPVLVAATSIAESERLSELLSSRFGIDNEVLNALGHRSAREAEVVASAGRCRRAEAGDGRVGAVTVATLMAGRGTDIEVDEKAIFAHCRVPPVERLADLGVEGDQDYPPGSCKCCIHCPQHDPQTRCAHCFKPKVDPDFPHRGRTACRQEVPCGLHVVGAGRHAVRACDDQLRLRAGRGGHPGSSRFFLCPADPVIAELGDELKDLAGPDAASRELIEGPEISEAVERAQHRAEGRRATRPACMVLRRL
ncbi:MAG: preprotein translocase subunit SecA, partial [Planctomycetota bacterium]